MKHPIYVYIIDYFRTNLLYAFSSEKEKEDLGGNPKGILRKKIKMANEVRYFLLE